MLQLPLNQSSPACVPSETSVLMLVQGTLTDQHGICLLAASQSPHGKPGHMLDACNHYSEDILHTDLILALKWLGGYRASGRSALR